jgi:hypothetical protein
MQFALEALILAYCTCHCFGGTNMYKLHGKAQNLSDKLTGAKLRTPSVSKLYTSSWARNCVLVWIKIQSGRDTNWGSSVVQICTTSQFRVHERKTCLTSSRARNCALRLYQNYIQVHGRELETAYLSGSKYKAGVT